MDEGDEELLVFLWVVAGVGALWAGAVTLLALGVGKAIGLRNRRG